LTNQLTLSKAPIKRRGPTRLRADLAVLPADPKAPFQFALTPKQRAFLTVFTSNNSVTKSALKIGISPITHHCWMRQDVEYAKAFTEEAIPAAAQYIQDRATKLAFEGWHDGVYFEGRKIGKKWQHDSQLAVTLLKGTSPKYKDGASGGNVAVQVNLIQGDKEL